ncbi:MAG: hypothetical protein ABSG41_08250 [Bryobacteraceae bacterium]|jgi:hypothetical protein
MNRTISLPEDLLKKAEELAAIERLSLEEFLSAKLSEQFVDFEYLKRPAERASTEKFRAALLRIPDMEPGGCDSVSSPSSSEP